jgi:hypothetical protein
VAILQAINPDAFLIMTLSDWQNLPLPFPSESVDRILAATCHAKVIVISVVGAGKESDSYVTFSASFTALQATNRILPLDAMRKLTSVLNFRLTFYIRYFHLERFMTRVIFTLIGNSIRCTSTTHARNRWNWNYVIDHDSNPKEFILMCCLLDSRFPLFLLRDHV